MKKTLVFFIAVLMILGCQGVLGAHITKFNGISASPSDQVNVIRLAQDQSGNVTVIFNDIYTLTNTTNKLVITYNINISKYTYTALGDTSNLSVSRTNTSLTFTYSGNSSVNITQVDLTFDYGPKLTVNQGIDTSNYMSNILPLAYVSKYTNDYTVTNTSEKISYIVYSPKKVFTSIFAITSPKNATMNYTYDKLVFNLSKCDNNYATILASIQRGTYNSTVVPITSLKIYIMLNNTYITSVVTKSTKNCTEIGYLSSDGYTNISYISTNDGNKLISISGNLWNTNGSLDNGIVVKYVLDPVGGLPSSVSDNYTVSITSASAITSAPKGAMWWFSWKVEGIPILAWVGIVFAITFFVLVIWRYSKGLRPIPKSASAQAIIVASWTYLAVLSTLSNVWHNAFEWLANNPGIGSVLILMTIALIWLAKVHLLTSRE